MSLRNNIFKLALSALILLSTILTFPQPYQRELDIIPVSDNEGLINNTFSGGHNNLEHQFIDIDGDGEGPPGTIGIIDTQTDEVVKLIEIEQFGSGLVVEKID